MTQIKSHEIQVLLTNGRVVQFTLHELSSFIRSKHMLGFVIVFLVGITASNPVMFPTLPEFRLRAIYWTISLVFYLMFLPFWLALAWKIWSRFSDKPIPHLLITVPYVMPQAILGMYVWTAYAYPEDLGGPLRVVSTAAKNTVLAHLAEMGAAIWLLPSFRNSRNATPVATADAADDASDRHFIVLNGRSVPLSSIRMARSAEHYLILTTDQRTVDLRARMKDFLEQVSDKDGVQTHRSVWIAAREAEELTGNVVRTKSGGRLPVSRGRLPEVRSWFERQGKPH